MTDYLDKGKNDSTSFSPRRTRLCHRELNAQAEAAGIEFNVNQRGSKRRPLTKAQRARNRRLSRVLAGPVNAYHRNLHRWRDVVTGREQAISAADVPQPLDVLLTWGNESTTHQSIVALTYCTRADASGIATARANRFG